MTIYDVIDMMNINGVSFEGFQSFVEQQLGSDVLAVVEVWIEDPTDEELESLQHSFWYQTDAEAEYGTMVDELIYITSTDEFATWLADYSIDTVEAFVDIFNYEGWSYDEVDTNIY